ncbi:MAG TPA: DUF6600 domain-containing protein [Bacteroidota bacterium]|nr:DUF6600 domain-containing protein [Bacteroidota bacterium]
MKSIFRMLAIVVLLIAASWMVPSSAPAQETTVSFQLFYDELSPYGMWVEYPSYGYVWIPDVDRDFRPYGTEGYWVFTDYGWTWVSGYTWGWAPFHYGRWVYDDMYGWLWVPDTEWGPAWVLWRSAPGYYGWAPMGPGVSIEVSIGGGYQVPNDRWIFVSDRYITSPQVNRYYIDRTTNVTIINQSTVINNTFVDNSRHVTYVAGPGKEDVQRVTGAQVKAVALQENGKPGQVLANDQLRIYRPRVEKSADQGRKPVPSKVTNLKEVKPVTERQGGQRRNEEKPANRTQPTPQQTDKKQGGQQRQEMNTPEKKEPERQPRREVSPPAKQDNTKQPEMRSPRTNPKETPRQKAAPAEQQQRQTPAAKPTDKKKSAAPPVKKSTSPQPKKKGGDVKPKKDDGQEQ